MIALALCLALAQAPEPHGPGPGPRIGCAGLAGFQSVSTIDYGTVKNRLTATYVFPDRARWHFDDPGAKVPRHRFFHRVGERAFVMEGGGSRPLVGEERDDLLRQMELRRAVMYWPDGFAWEAQADGTHAAQVYADSCCHERPLGTLVAQLSDGRPSRVEVRDGGGQVRQVLTVLEWQAALERSWPRKLSIAGEGVGFTEIVEVLETQFHYLDLFFVPPDQRALPKGTSGAGKVNSMDLVAIRYVPRDLPPDLTWDQAVTTTRAWLQEASETGKSRGWVFDPAPTIEVGPEGNPVRAWLRLKEPGPAPIEGLTSRGERPGLLLALSALSELGSRPLDRLRAAVPAGSTAGTPYLRVHDRPVAPVELVLPLEPGE